MTGKRAGDPNGNTGAGPLPGCGRRGSPPRDQRWSPARHRWRSDVRIGFSITPHARIGRRQAERSGPWVFRTCGDRDRLTEGDE